MSTSSTSHPSAPTNNSTNPTMVGEQLSTSNQDIVSFQSEGAQAPLILNYQGISQLGAETMGDQDHQIESFLARPVLLHEGNLVSSSGYGSLIVDGNFLQDWFKHETISRKLHDFYSLSGTFCLRMTTNAMPFQTGLYFLNQQPQQMEVTTGFESQQYSEWRSTTGLSDELLIPNTCGYPGVYINLADTSEQDLKVPYVGSWNSINLKWAVNNRYGLYCLSPVRGPTSAEHVPFRLYGWMENVKLHGADPWPLGTAITFQGDTSALDDLLGAAGISQGKEAMDMIAGTDLSVSGVAGTVHKIASKFQNVPEVAEFAAPVAWLSGIVEKTAKMFGYSKPSDPRPSESVVQSPFREFGTCDGASEFQKLTVNRDQAVAVDPLGPTSEDEMCIKYILNRPQMMSHFEWKKTQPPGTLLADFELLPWAMLGRTELRTNGDSTKLRMYGHTYMSYLAGLFMYWRGTINLTFTVVANKFYSGRLRFVYLLNASSEGGADDQTAFDEPNKYSHVVDIRDATTFKISFPFINVNHWASVNQSYKEYEPRVRVYIESELIGPETVHSTVDVWTSVSAGDDFEFSGPRLDAGYMNLAPIMDGYMAATLEAYDEVDLSRVHYQGFTQDDNTNNIVAEIEMAPKPAQHASVVALTQTIGDPVLSLRTLVKRPMPKSLFSMPADTFGMIMPFSNEVDIHSSRVGTYVERVQALYRYKRGGIRLALRGLDRAGNYQFKLVDIGDFDNALTITKRFPNNVLQAAPVEGTASLEWFQQVPTVADIPYREDLQGAIMLEVPYYTLYTMMDAAPVQMPATPTFSAFQRIKNGNLAIMWFNKSAVSDVTLYESAADDFTTGYLIGPPVTFELQ